MIVGNNALMMEGCKHRMLSRPCPASRKRAVIAQAALKISTTGRMHCMHVLALAPDEGGINTFAALNHLWSREHAQ